MRVRGAIAIVVLVAALVAGCGGGSTATGAAKRAVGGIEDEEGGIFEVGGPGPPPADGTAPLHGARLKKAEALHVWEGEMVRGDEGWVRSSIGLFWTADGGRTWRPLTSPVPGGRAFGSVYFASPRRGWALHENGREGDAHPSIYMTSDGGRTWHHTRLRGYDKLVMPAAEASFSLVDGHELFALVRASGDTASSFGTLFVSHDAGRHWRVLPTPPHAGRISFETPRRGWLVGRSPGRGLWRTVDGGRTWALVEPGKPLVPWPPEEVSRGPHESPPAESVGTEFRWVDYTTPLIGPAGHGILGMVESSGEGIEQRGPTRTLVWRTDDYGRSWHHRDRIDLPIKTGFLEAEQLFTRLGRGRSLLVHDPSDSVSAVVGPDGRPGPLRPTHGLLPYSEGLTFSDARHGFAFPIFSNGFSLSYTEDGGRKWSQVPVPRPPPCRSTERCDRPLPTQRKDHQHQDH
ncbi:MAG TPA: hypothetical protein VEB65_12445 [Solirubrobacterales bacterium]|nr:hypothetical protein [Solirubrobacterales bacterium]